MTLANTELSSPIAASLIPAGLCRCGKCGGTGDFARLDSRSGRYVRVGACFACIGKGYQDAEDVKRNRTYWKLNAARIAFANSYA